MNTFRTKQEVRDQVKAWHREGLTVALVPTMGYLHEGHLSLMRIAKGEADRVVVSDFVNPTQFGPNEDFAAYPRDEAGDLARCEAVGVDAVFLPTAAEMYAEGATVHVVEDRMSKVLCGVTRPIHFGGVLTVVLKLFHIVTPDVAVFGQKDAQQLAIIRRMVRDLDVPVRIVGAPIVREASGLAMSSRNTYLSAEEKERALALRHSLDAAEAAWAAGETDVAAVKGRMRGILEGAGAAIDYIEMVDADSLEAVPALRPGTLVAIAAKIGRTRLIDNTVLA